jgi:hypothetical protein
MIFGLDGDERVLEAEPYSETRKDLEADDLWGQ